MELQICTGPPSPQAGVKADKSESDTSVSALPAHCDSSLHTPFPRGANSVMTCDDESILT